MTGHEIGSKRSEGQAEWQEYLSYLLRLWQADAPGQDPRPGPPEWRGSLESSLTGERLGFANLEELFVFLQRQTGMAAEVGEKQSQDEREG